MKRKTKIRYFKLEENLEYYITMGDKRVFLWCNTETSLHNISAPSSVSWGEWKKVVKKDFRKEANIKEVSELEIVLVCGTNLVSRGTEWLEIIGEVVV